MRKVIHRSDTVIVDSLVRIPRRLVDLPSVRRQFTVTVKNQEGETTAIAMYREDSQCIALPRRAGMDMVRLNKWKYEDRMSNGYEILDDLPPIKLWPEQVLFVDEMEDAVLRYNDVVIQSRTASGKTIMSLEVARRLNTTVLVVVDQDNIKEQWIERISSDKAWRLPKERIGLIQGNICDYDDKTIVIGMIQTLYQRQLNQDVLNYFGFVIIDETHVASAPRFAEVCNKFTAAYRMGVTATPRKDQYKKIIESHLGAPQVVSENRHDKSKVCYVEYGGVLSWYANISPKSGRYVTELSEDTERNWLLSQIIQNLYNDGREILVISDRIEQLENIRAMCYYLGIPEDETCLITGFDTQWKYAKDATPIRKPEHLEPKAEYTPVKVQRVRKRVNKKRRKDRDSRGYRVRFATYAIFGKAMDVPSLDAGVDCTPRAKVEQVHGRILRGADGKQMPVWITIRDYMSYKAEHQFANRINDYRKSNADLHFMDIDNNSTEDVNISVLQREIRERIEWLKELKNVKTPEGNNMLLM